MCVGSVLELRCIAMMNPDGSSPGADSNGSLHSSSTPNGLGLGSPDYATSPDFTSATDSYNSPTGLHGGTSLDFNNSPASAGSNNYSVSPGFAPSPGLLNTSPNFSQLSPDTSYSSPEFSSGSAFQRSPSGQGYSSPVEYFPPNISASSSYNSFPEYSSSSNYNISPGVFSANSMGSSPPPNFLGNIPSKYSGGWMIVHFWIVLVHFVFC